MKTREEIEKGFKDEVRRRMHVYPSEELLIHTQWFLDAAAHQHADVVEELQRENERLRAELREIAGLAGKPETVHVPSAVRVALGGAYKERDALAEKVRELEQLSGDYCSDCGWNAIFGSEPCSRCALLCERAARERAEGALRAALPKLAHDVECVALNPIADWPEKGSWNAEGCCCVIAVIRATLPAPSDEGKEE